MIVRTGPSFAEVNVRATRAEVEAAISILREAPHKAWLVAVLSFHLLDLMTRYVTDKTSNPVPCINEPGVKHRSHSTDLDELEGANLLMD